MATPEDQQHLMQGDVDEEAQLQNGTLLPGPGATTARSHYALTRREATRSMANRLIHSRAYILFYLTMAALSITTVVLSLVKGCPGAAFFVLELIINSSMILEVAMRMVALSKLFWKSIFNWIDVAVTLFCAVTVIVIFSTPCASKGEEVFDTIILIARNAVQFGRLFAIMRKSGTSIFSRPKPIDLSRSRAVDIDMEDEDDVPEYATPLVSNEVLFDARREPVRAPRPTPPAPPPGQEDLWANVG